MLENVSMETVTPTLGRSFLSQTENTPSKPRQHFSQEQQQELPYSRFFFHVTLHCTLHMWTL